MSKEKQNSTEGNYLIAGADVGTGTLLFAKLNSEGKVEVNQIRDMFIYVQPDQISASEMANSKLDYITQLDGDGDVEFHAVVGEDALRLSNVFNSKINRPMSQGMLSPDEIHAAPIITAMFKNIINEPVNGGHLIFSVPSQPIDADDTTPVHFHQEMFKNIFKEIGFTTAIPLNEAHAIIFSQCANENFTGIGISFGAGQVNVCLSWKGTLLFAFSTGRSGDWIDSYAAKSSGTIPNRITTIKEKSDFSVIKPFVATIKNKKESNARQALKFSYELLIDYTLDIIRDQFIDRASSLELDDVTLPIVIGGGTSLPHGFIDLFKSKFAEIKDFPLEISEIRHATNPLEAVAIGCLTYSQWSKNKNG